MAGFRPLNVIFDEDEESEEEVDDSKELQIEEALKLYQSALKLHSQGPDFFIEAEAAYDELFGSEIFKYPESLSEEKWLEVYGDADLDEDTNDVGPDVSLPAAALDTNPNSLPQILYLAHKNFGQFRLEKLKYRLSRLEQELVEGQASNVKGEINKAANTGLGHLAEALGRDDSDLELWRRVSRLGEYLGSQRLARFCLESVLDEAEDSLVEEPDFSNLEHRFAAERLRYVLQKLQDPASESQLKQLLEGRKPLPSSLRSFVDPCPYLPEPRLLANTDGIGDLQASTRLLVSDYTWAGVGKAIILQHQQNTQGTLEVPSGTLYHIDAPINKSSPAGGSNVVLPLQEASETQNDKVMTEDGAADNAIEENQAAMEIAEIAPGSPDMAPTALETNVGIIDDGPPSASTKANDEAVITDAEAHDSQIDQASKDTLPTVVSPRKRSSDEAELLDNNESTRGRSKRIKARKSANEPLAKGESAEESARWYTKQMDIYVQADDLAFQFIDGILSLLQCKTIGSVQALKTCSQPRIDPGEGGILDSTNHAVRSFRRLLDTWDQSKSRAFVKGNGLKEFSKTAQNPDLSNVLQYSMQEDHRKLSNPELNSEHLLATLQETGVAQRAYTTEELGMRWLLGLLSSTGKESKSSFYLSHKWSESLKATVVQLLVELDAQVWDSVNGSIETVPFEVIQSVFELHLDIYGRITNPGSKVDQTTRDLQRDKLSRWSMLANQTVALASEDDGVTLSNLEIRFLWCTIVSNSLLELDTSAPRVIFYQEIIRILRLERDHRGKEIVISLINNAVVPEISVSAAEKEVSRITTIDFFTTIFSTDDKDSFSVIENLQPLLDLSVEDGNSSTKAIPHDGADALPSDNGAFSPTRRSETMLEALRFMNQSNVTLKLFLWQKLRDAYGSVNFPPMILSCNLRSFALMIDQLSSPTFDEVTQEKDLEPYLHWLHKLDDLLTPILALILTDVKALDCIDYDHLCSIISSVISLIQILHTFTMWEDSIRVGQISAPAQPGSAAVALQTKSAEKFRDMIIKLWSLLYLFIKEATFQNLELFPKRNEDLLTYLRLVHNCLGTRTYCSFNNKMLLKIERTEMLRLKGTVGWDTDMPQVIYDLYGLKISCDGADTQDHTCEPIDVDKKTAFDVLDTIIVQVNRLSTKDLLKHDLRFAVDKLQQVIKVPKISDTTSPRGFNKRVINNYLKSPINPMELFRSNKGEGDLNGMRVNTDGSDVAKRGWYFLLGHIALTKFRSQKRITAAATEDLENAKMFFKLDLEFDNEKWETWFRLGQVFDSLLDEQTTWTADKLDRDQSSLVELQRQAILCYNMALAIASRTENVSLEEASKMADLRKEYGHRMYSSSREPFSMKAFSLEDFERLYNGESSGMYRREPFRPLTLYRAWKLSSALLHRACCEKPTDWTTWYALGKVLWKMHSCADTILAGANRISYERVINALVQAIEVVPDKRDSKHTEKDPTLEPHYKLLTVVHKLVRRRTISVEEACQILEVTSFSRRVSPIQDPDEWVDYMQEILSAMKAADKSNWHHRLVARAARTIYETDPDDPRTWLGAKHELTQQIFTKTMTIQVWRPENERCGRHFVYTGRYVHFLLEILYKLKDKESVEALAKRIRKKSGDFVNHLNVWYGLCVVYLLILRERIEGQVGFKIEPGFDDTYFKNINLEEFQSNAARIEAWIHKPATACSEVETLRDAIEFKKLNNKLLKESEVETTIADIYTAIYATQAEKLRLKETEEENRVRMRVDNLLFNPITADPSKKEPSPLPDQEPTKRRFNVITHREVIRRAEALMTKPPPIATPKTINKTLPMNTLDQTRSPGIAVVIPTRENSRENASAPATPNSVHSIHDSADDESELSDPDDDDVAGYETAQEEDAKEAVVEDRPKLQPRRSSMFPNMMGFSAANEAAASEQGSRGHTPDRQSADQNTTARMPEVPSDQLVTSTPTHTHDSFNRNAQTSERDRDVVMGEVSDR